MKLYGYGILFALVAVTMTVSPAFSQEKSKGREFGMPLDEHRDHIDRDRIDRDRPHRKHDTSVNRKSGSRPRRDAGELPPGLEKYEDKHGGQLPPGLEKQLDEKGHLPPGLRN